MTGGDLSWEQRERFAELDIYSVLVRPDGQGVVAVDALVVLRFESLNNLNDCRMRRS